MSNIYIIAAFVVENNQKNAAEKIKRRVLRDHSNPLSFSNSLFVQQYRLNKEAFTMILDEITPHLGKHSIPEIIQLATALRFFAEGSYQRSVGKDANVGLGRSTVSKVIANVCKVLERKICSKWINLKTSDSERRECMAQFYNKYKIPGVVGCIDGTHIKLIQPAIDGFTYYNRKGYHSINAMIICDQNMVIRAIDATHPGSSHDAFIWKLSKAYSYFLTKYQSGENCLRLLGDSGYGIEPFLLTPFRSPVAGSSEHIFNLKHASARNIVERTIGVLKSRFRCLIGCLHYSPRKAVQMTNVCCALHNICRFYKINYDAEYTEATNDESMPDNEDNEMESQNATLLTEGRRLRNEIAQTFNRV